MAAKWTGYGQYCPVSRALDVLGERWSLLILRDMLVGATRFNDLSRGLPGLSRTLLSKRLRQLERVGIVEHVGDEYLLTDSGRDLFPIVFGLGEWGARWAFGDPTPEELDAELLAWWMHNDLDTSTLSERRVVFRLQFQDDRRLFWFVIEAGEPSVCYVDPGYEVDVTISSDLQTLHSVWLGHLGLMEAARSGRIRFDGPSEMTRRMPDVLKLSPMAPLVAAVRTDS